MLHDLIPNFDDEIAQMHALAPSGWIMGFNLTYKGPDTCSTPIPTRGAPSMRTGTISSAIPSRCGR